MRGVGERSLGEAAVSEAYFFICSSFVCEAEHTPLSQQANPKPQRGAVYPGGPETTGTWRVRGWGRHSLSSHSHFHPKLAGEMSPNCLVFCFDVATVWPPRLTLVQLDPVDQTRPDCPVLETGRHFPLCEGLGLPSPEHWANTSCLPNPSLMISSCQGRRRRSRHIISSRPCSFCPFISAQHKVTRERIGRGGVLGVRGWIGCVKM